MREAGEEVVTLAHGGGGRAMQRLIEDVFASVFGNPLLDLGEDQARIELAELSGAGDRLAFTTDSYVVDPLFFPGGDIGKLAVNGTVNDLAVGGAEPRYLSCSVIIEEGFPVAQLRRVAASMAEAAENAGVLVVTGDTKVVPRGAADKLFINTAGVGVIPAGIDLSTQRAGVDDVVIINGYFGDHGAAIMNARGDLGLQADLESDSQPLNHLVRVMLAACPGLRCLRDATRGGVATVLCEIAQRSGYGIVLDESALPVRNAVKGVCEILGLDPLYFANEGKLVAVAPADGADALLRAMRDHPCGRNAAVIGEVVGASPGAVRLQTAFGGQRMVDTLVGEQLPRIC